MKEKIVNLIDSYKQELACAICRQSHDKEIGHLFYVVQISKFLIDLLLSLLEVIVQASNLAKGIFLFLSTFKILKHLKQQNCDLRAEPFQSNSSNSLFIKAV